jgi:putative transposase
MRRISPLIFVVRCSITWGGIIKNEKGALIAAGGTPDHVHLLAGSHPDKAVADIVRLIKANSSKWVHENFPPQSAFAWQAGYGAFSVSRSNLDEVRRYIENQDEHHRRVSFEEEFRQFLDRHGIAYDPRYLWR